MDKRTVIFNHLFSLIILFPVFISFLFKVIGLPIPTYLFIFLISFLITLFVSNNHFTISKSLLKVVFFTFFIWVLSSMVYTPSVIASKTKFIGILYNTIFPVIIIEIFFLSSKMKVIEMKSFGVTLLRYSYVLIWVTLLAFVFFRQADVSGRYTLLGVDNTIWFSRFIGMLILVIICNSRMVMSNLVFLVGTVLVGFFLMFAAGSRGPVVSVLIVFFIKKSYQLSKNQLLGLVLGLASFLIIGFLFIGGYLFETDFYSIYARFDLFNALSDFDLQYIKGSGIGSYAFLIFGEDVTYYPHNIFLEIFFENGLIGVFLFSFIMYLFFKSFKPNILNLLCLYYFIASLVSGDIPGNNNFFILLYISIYANQNYPSKEKFSLVNQ